MAYLIICDIDGTINMMGKKFSKDRILTVEPMKHARETLMEFSRRGSSIVYLTGRSANEMREETVRWLEMHGFPNYRSSMFFGVEHGPWSWPNYVKFKEKTITELASRYTGFIPIVLDDNELVLEALKKAGISCHKIRSGEDWRRLQRKYFRKSRLPTPEGASRVRNAEPIE